MQTRSRAKGTSPQTPSSSPKRSSKQTPNGSIASSSSSSSRNKASDKAAVTPQVNGDKNKAQTTPVKRRSSISRASAATWHFIVRKWEIPRKTLHVSIGFICLWLYMYGWKPRDVAPLLVYMFIPAFFGDVIRFISPQFNRLWVAVMGPLMRDREKQTWNGVIFYLLGAWIVLSFFPKDIAIVSILLLSWSDTAASTFGRLYGHYGPMLRPGKSLIGSLSAMLTGALAAYVYWGLLYPRYESNTPARHFYWSKDSIFDFSFTREGSVSWTRSTSKLGLWELCSLTGLVAGLAEAVDLWGVDDNLVIPVLSALMLRGSIWLLSKVK